MRICEVLGTVTLGRRHDDLPAGRLLVTRPLTAEALTGGSESREEAVVVYDDLGAAPDLRIAVSEGREAAMPFHPRRVPLDAYCAAILDSVDVERP